MVDLELSLPLDKLQEIREVVELFLTRKRASKAQLQQFAGKLNWACRVVYGGRTFLRRVINQLSALGSSKAKCILTPEFRKDLFWWKAFLSTFNGKCHFHAKLPIADAQTDACSQAVGGHFQGDWFYSWLPADAPALAPRHINFKEAFALYLAAKRWANRWANHHVILYSDNQAAVAMINKGTTKDSMIMDCLREVFWLSAVHNFRLTSVYIPGSNNMLADSIFRLHEWERLQHFWQYLCKQNSLSNVCSTPLNLHMSLYSILYLYHRYSV